MIVSTVVTADR